MSTQSGYPFISDYGDPVLLNNPVIPGSDGVRIMGGLRQGPPAIVLLYVCSRLNAEVERADQPLGYWGFDPNHNAVTSTSNHKGGVAVDYAASRHPRGSRGTWSNVSKLRQILSDCDGVIGWGGDFTYPSTVDEMHFEPRAGIYGSGRLEALAAAIQAGRKPNVPAELRTGSQQEDDVALTPEDRKAISNEAARSVVTELWEQKRVVGDIDHALEILHTRVTHAQNIDGTPVRNA